MLIYVAYFEITTVYFNLYVLFAIYYAISHCFQGIITNYDESLTDCRRKMNLRLSQVHEENTRISNEYEREITTCKKDYAKVILFAIILLFVQVNTVVVQSMKWSCKG